MNYVIIDDDRSICHILKQIIDERQLGTVIDTFTDPVEAFDEIPSLRPDIVLIDLLMPGMDGISFIREYQTYPIPAFVMISQVDSADMIADAYSAGVEFFIRKPINSVETESVLLKLQQHLQMKRTITKMQNLINADFEEIIPRKRSNSAGSDSIKAQSEAAVNSHSQVPSMYVDGCRAICERIGIGHESGCEDIVIAASYMASRGIIIGDMNVRKLCEQLTENPVAMEQRMRRAIAQGLTNLAHMGLEDYYDENFTRYSKTLFNFEQVRLEMSHIQGKSQAGGSVRLKNFLNALANCCVSELQK